MRAAGLGLLILTACGGAAPPPSPPPTTTAARPLAAQCERHYARERVCADDYLAELVRTRVELDMPRGLAADDARDGRDALIARARAEWEVEAQPAARTAICDALDDQVPAARVDALLAQGERCLALASCAEFAVCAVNDERSYIESGDRH
jgi:O-methyltransferase involved in polyketide biosynthesis